MKYNFEKYLFKGNFVILNLSDFDDLANGVLTLYDASLDEITILTKLLRKIPFFGVNCLELASIGERETFLACPCVQNHLTRIWYGKMSVKDDLSPSLKVNFPLFVRTSLYLNY
jgi:hypothetical protein